MFGMAYGGWTWWRIWQHDRQRGQAVPPMGSPLKEFVLTERRGEPFRSADMQGKVWVTTYFFTTCPGQCRRMNDTIQVLHMLPELKDVTWISITCDPDTDTLETLRKYAEERQADPQRWLFCRGDLDYTQRIALGMKVFLSRKGHQDYAIVIDKAGKIRGMFDATSLSDIEKLKAMLVQCVKEEPPHDLAAAAPEEKKSS
jgi:cytochrome oxidase Cu insertion factor (SCO1/SenC/PrrC family)